MTVLLSGIIEKTYYNPNLPFKLPVSRIISATAGSEENISPTESVTVIQNSNQSYSTTSQRSAL